MRWDCDWGLCLNICKYSYLSCAGSNNSNPGDVDSTDKEIRPGSVWGSQFTPEGGPGICSSL